MWMVANIENQSLLQADNIPFGMHIVCTVAFGMTKSLCRFVGWWLVEDVKVPCSVWLLVLKYVQI